MSKTVRYRSVRSTKLSLGLLVNGQSVNIDFVGGYEGMARRLPTYTTSCPHEQEAMEKSSGFGLYYTKEWEQETPDVDPIIPDVTPPEGEEDVIPDSEDVPNIFGRFSDESGVTIDNAKPVVVVDDITNAQEAKAYLIASYPGETSQMPNKASTLAEAARLGVSFPNWK